MHVIRDRRSLRLRVPTSVPSSQTRPPQGSTRRHSATMRELLPLPVRPQMPTFSPALTSKETPFSTNGKPGRYLISSRSNDMAPLGGHPGGGLFAPPGLTIAPVDSSVSSSVYSEILSTLTMLDSSSEITRMSHESSPVMSMA